MFSKKPEQTQTARQNRRSSDRSMAGKSTFSVIGSDVTIKGDVTATTELHVDGRIEGDISCASIVQGEASVIQGGVKAETARLAGTLTGSIAARELVILQTAHIHGDVQYDALTIEQGAVVEGQFSPQGSKAPTASANSDEKSASGEEPKLSLAT